MGNDFPGIGQVGQVGQVLQALLLLQLLQLLLLPRRQLLLEGHVGGGLEGEVGVAVDGEVGQAGGGGHRGQLEVGAEGNQRPAEEY